MADNGDPTMAPKTNQATPSKTNKITTPKTKSVKRKVFTKEGMAVRPIRLLFSVEIPLWKEARGWSGP